MNQNPLCARMDSIATHSAPTVWKGIVTSTTHRPAIKTPSRPDVLDQLLSRAPTAFPLSAHRDPQIAFETVSREQISATALLLSCHPLVDLVLANLKLRSLAPGHCHYGL